MAKTAVKRKSEGDSPAKNKKQKAALIARGDVNLPEQQQLSSDAEKLVPVYVKKGRSKPRQSAPVDRHDDEYEVDEGRMESQQFLALVEIQSRKKKMAAKAAGDFLEKFKASIQNEEQALRKRLEGLEQAATKEDKDFTVNFTRAYNASRPTNPPPTQLPLAQSKGPTPPSNYFSTLYKRSRHLVTNAHSIVSHFESASEATAKLEAGGGLLSNAWEAENESIVQLMAIGHRVGVEKVEAMLQGSKIPQVEEGDGRFVEVLYEGEGGGDGDAGESLTWGKLAKKQLKAGKRLYRTTLAAEPGHQML